MRDPISMISRIAETGEIDPTAARWLGDSLRGWWLDGRDPARLATFLHLPSGSRYDVAERNRWLCLAGSELPAKERAAELHRRISAFMRQQWPLWRGLSTPPECEPIESALFYAADAGASMSITRRQLGYILNGK